MVSMMLAKMCLGRELVRKQYQSRSRSRRVMPVKASKRVCDPTYWSRVSFSTFQNLFTARVRSPQSSKLKIHSFTGKGEDGMIACLRRCFKAMIRRTQMKHGNAHTQTTSPFIACMQHTAIVSSLLSLLSFAQAQLTSL